MIYHPKVGDFKAWSLILRKANLAYYFFVCEDEKIFFVIIVRGLAVGIYTTNSPDACKYVIEDSQSSIIVVENKIQLDKILEVCFKVVI